MIYPGSLELDDAEANPLEETGFRALEFADPAELVCFFDPQINAGEVTLHPWQVEVTEQLAAARPTSKNPYKFALCAANGSGKDYFVIAPFVIWFALTKIQSLCVITSSSGVQLTSQTENYIKRLAEKVNLFYGQTIFKIRQRFIYCSLTGSEIRLFATDEEGKAEGYHPLEPNKEFAIIVNEAKTVAPEIFRALRRCTGYNYFIEVSTPGEPSGDFHRHFTSWQKYEYENAAVKLSRTRRVNYYDCPHLSEIDFEEDKQEFGEHSALFRSKWLALFTSMGGQTVIGSDNIDKCIKTNCPWIFKKWPKRVGIDFAAGGDETVVSIWQGNKRIAQLAFRERDTVVATDFIDKFLGKNNIPKDHIYIWADDGGIGRGYIDNLQRLGYTGINRILNNHAALRKKEFGNRGAELWFKFARLIQECVLILPVDDERGMTQLAQRYYRESTGGRFFLQSKPEAKSEGRPSPDRADADVLAFTDLSLDDFLKPEEEPNKSKNKYMGTTLEEIESNLDSDDTPKHRPIKGSSRVMLKNHNKGNSIWQKN